MCQEFAGGSRSDFANRRSIAFQKNNDVIKNISGLGFLCIFSLQKSESCTNGQRSTKSFDITWLPCSLCVCTHWDVPMSIRKFFFLLQSSKIGKTVFTSQHRKRENWIPADDFSSLTISVAQNYYLATYRTIEITTFYTYRHISTISCDLSGISEIGYFYFFAQGVTSLWFFHYVLQLFWFVT